MENEMKNETKTKLQILSVKLPEQLIEEIKQIVKWRKENNYTMDTIQEQVEVALRQHIARSKSK